VSQGGQTRPVRQIGGWLMIPDPLVVEAAGRAGFDWVGLDMQHGAWDLEKAFRAVQLLDVLGTPAIVRVSQEDLPILPRVLDHGAAGVIVAMVESVEVAATAVSASRYAPQGHRSWVAQRYGMRSTPEPGDVSKVRPAIYAMIEDRRGLEAVEEIARVPELAGLHIGPVDLGLGLGLGMDRSGETYAAALRRILAAGHAAGIPVTLHAVLPEEAAAVFEEGFDEVVLTADVFLLRAAMADHVARTRSHLR
jgi:4-hydroxy-2-oxoheptanedioate aldolase